MKQKIKCKLGFHDYVHVNPQKGYCHGFKKNVSPSTNFTSWTPLYYHDAICIYCKSLYSNTRAYKKRVRVTEDRKAKEDRRFRARREAIEMYDSNKKYRDSVKASLQGEDPKA